MSTPTIEERRAAKTARDKALAAAGFGPAYEVEEGSGMFGLALFGRIGLTLSSCLACGALLRLDEAEEIEHNGETVLACKNVRLHRERCTWETP